MIQDSNTEAKTRQGAAPTKRLQIAIDGPAGAGKSTVAKRVSEVLHYLYIDTGAMYRAITWLALNKDVRISDGQGMANLAARFKVKLEPGTEGEKARVFIDGTDITREIRTQEVTRFVSNVSTIAAVREHLVEQQREMATRGGVVLDGRDIGTVVLPNADLKIFLTATAEVRAHRRMKELVDEGEKPDYDELLADIKERDDRDTNRAVAPLRMADDAVLILTDNMTIEEVVSHIVKLCV